METRGGGGNGSWWLRIDGLVARGVFRGGVVQPADVRRERNLAQTLQLEAEIGAPFKADEPGSIFLFIENHGADARILAVGAGEHECGAKWGAFGGAEEAPPFVECGFVEEKDLENSSSGGFFRPEPGGEHF
jgi:hypothetical protein